MPRDQSAYDKLIKSGERTPAVLGGDPQNGPNAHGGIAATRVRDTEDGQVREERQGNVWVEIERREYGKSFPSHTG